MLFTCLSLFERKIESKEDIILHVKSLLKLWTKLLRIFSIDSILYININHLYRSHLQFLLSFSVKFHIFLVFKKCIEKIKGGSNGWKRRELCSFLSKKNEKLKAKNISWSGLSSNFLAFDQRLVARYLSFKRIKISLSTLIAFQRITLSLAQRTVKPFQPTRSPRNVCLPLTFRAFSRNVRTPPEITQA